MLKQICKVISDYMGALVLLSAALGLLLPDVFDNIKPTVINPLLGVIMFGMGLTLKPKDFAVVFSRPKDVITGCVAQFTIMPMLAWLLSRAFSLDEALTIGVVLVGCCPGGTASNVITYLAKGPLLVWLLAGKSVDVDVMGMLLSILWVVILPIALGLIANRLWPRLTEQASAYLPALSSLTICFIVLIIISANAAKLMAGGLTIILVVMLHNLFGLLLGYGVGRMLGMNSVKRRAVSIEVGMQNSGLASGLATIHFAAYPMATIPGAVFSVWHNLSGAIVARAYARLANRTKGEAQ